MVKLFKWIFFLSITIIGLYCIMVIGNGLTTTIETNDVVIKKTFEHILKGLLLYGYYLLVSITYYELKLNRKNYD